ncbi:hypothetical protein [Pseudomonas pseudonitroreducens]|uniref:hypothetical protein n=1 Tax=Pseudomonas pseudonitroreducens TaxID=2892326 RepID=UPI001F358134|nr:hypothetical protein [Pseudomonas pseudonitroreducens]
MSDRELLELAAKAAGITGGWGEVHALPQGEVDCTDLWFLESDDQPYVWNPLTDDGDAFRLACSLRLDMAFLEGFEQIIVDDYHGSNRAEEDYQPDMAAAARRAVVRAAAEIGRTMK